MTGKIQYTLTVFIPSDKIMGDFWVFFLVSCFSDYIIYCKLSKHVFANMYKGDCCLRKNNNNNLHSEVGEDCFQLGEIKEGYREGITHEMNPKVNSSFVRHGQGRYL